jgi:hypothetical protein
MMYVRVQSLRIVAGSAKARSFRKALSAFDPWPRKSIAVGYGLSFWVAEAESLSIGRGILEEGGIAAGP